MATTRWDVDVEDYLIASAGTFAQLLAERGCLLQYLINNVWEDLTKPCRILEPWFTAAGFLYLCPQAEAEKLFRQENQTASIDVGDPRLIELLSPYLDRSRSRVQTQLANCQDVGQHIVQLDIDPVEDSFEQALSWHGRPGVLTVLRELAADPGTTVSAWYPESPVLIPRMVTVRVRPGSQAESVE